MIKKTVEYVDYDGNARKEELHFNLTQTELVEIAAELPEGLLDIFSGGDPTKVTEKEATEMLNQLGRKGIIDFMKMLLLKSYGVKSEDGRLFKKTPELAEEFSFTLAFDKLLMDLMSDEEGCAKFVNDVIPAQLVDQILPNGNVAVLPGN
jgi:hypothetical protein